MVRKSELMLGDVLIDTSSFENKWVFIDDLSAGKKETQKGGDISQHILVRDWETQKNYKQHEMFLLPIGVTKAILEDCGFRQNEKDGLTTFEIKHKNDDWEELTLTISLAVIDNYYTGLVVVNDWNKWIKSKENFNEEKHRQDFPSVRYLHELIRVMNDRSIAYDLDELIEVTK